MRSGRAEIENRPGFQQRFEGCETRSVLPIRYSWEACIQREREAGVWIRTLAPIHCCNCAWLAVGSWRHTQVCFVGEWRARMRICANASKSLVDGSICRVSDIIYRCVVCLQKPVNACVPLTQVRTSDGLVGKPQLPSPSYLKHVLSRWLRQEELLV